MFVHRKPFVEIVNLMFDFEKCIFYLFRPTNEALTV